MTFTVAPLLVTENLRLRSFTADDFAAGRSLWAGEQYGAEPMMNDEQVWSKLLRHLGHWQAQGYGYWAVEEAATGNFIGSVGLAFNRRNLPEQYAAWVETGWTLLPQAQGKGYAREAVRAIMAWAEQQRLGNIFCIIAPDNLRSKSLAEKSGFRFNEVTVYNGRVVWVYSRAARSGAQEGAGP